MVIIFLITLGHGLECRKKDFNDQKRPLLGNLVSVLMGCFSNSDRHHQSYMKENFRIYKR